MKSTVPPARSAAENAAALRRVDACRAWFGFELLEVAAGFARLGLTVRAEMINGRGACHEGVLFALADTAFGYASAGADEVAVTSSARIEYLSSVLVGAAVVATARQTHAAGRAIFYEVRIDDGSGRIVAIFSARGRRMDGVPGKRLGG